MKTWMKRILGVLLVCAMMLQTTAFALDLDQPMTNPEEIRQEEPMTDPTDPTDPVDPEEPTDPTEPVDPEEPTDPTEPTDPEEPTDPTDPTEPTEPEEPEDPLADYNIPDNWAGPALRFAVLNGILHGKGNNNLAPYDFTSRAEFAAILVRILGATEKADLSAYTDVNGEWFADPLAEALALHIFNGTSATTMDPNRQITRQEAFTATAQAFGLTAKDPTLYETFADSRSVQPYAREALCALMELGCVSGFEGNTVRPNNRISRAEVAVLLYRLLDAICDDPAQIPQEGFVIYRGTETLPEGMTHEGTLVLGAGFRTELPVKGLTVSDTLILRCATDAVVALDGCTAPEIRLVSGNLASADTLPLVTVRGNGGTVSADVTNLEVYAPVTVNGACTKAAVYKTPAVFTGAVGEILVDSALPGPVTVTGTLDTLTVTTEAPVELDGSVKTVNLVPNACVHITGDLAELNLPADVTPVTVIVDGNVNLVTMPDGYAGLTLEVGGHVDMVRMGENCHDLHFKAGSMRSVNLSYQCHDLDFRVEGNLQAFTGSSKCDNVTIVCGSCAAIYMGADSKNLDMTVNGVLGSLRFSDRCSGMKVHAQYITTATLKSGNVNDDITAEKALGTLSLGTDCTGLKLTCGDVETLTIPASCTEAVITVNGHADTIQVDAPYCTVQGEGYAELIDMTGMHGIVTLAHGTLNQIHDFGLEGVTVTVTSNRKISGSANSCVLTATFKGLKDGPGVENGGRIVTLQWYDGTTLLKTDSNYLLKDGSTATYTYTVPSTVPSTDPVIRAVVTLGSESVEGSCTVEIDRSNWDYQNALNIVQGVNIDATVTVRTYLYTDSERTSVKRTLEKGTHVTHLYFCDDASEPGKVRLDDGTVGWIDWADYYVSREDYVQKTDYSTGAKEGFVDKKGYSSSTRYLVWISLRTQRVNVFTGRKGDWTLYDSYPCSSGKNTTPTCTGNFTISYKTARWRFDGWHDGKYYDDLTRVYNVSGFWGGQAIHSILYWSETGKVYDGTLGTPKSHGCVRVAPENALYIYNNVPIGTTLIVF